MLARRQGIRFVSFQVGWYHRNMETTYADNGEPLSPALAARCKNVKDNPRARRFFRLYCAGMSQREAAQQVGVHPKTASWWRQHPDGKQLMREIYEQMDRIMMLDITAMHMANVESTLAKRRRR